MDDSQGPKLDVRSTSRAAGTGPGRWTFRWEIVNQTDAPVAIHEAWQPHGKFRGERQSYEPRAVVQAGRRLELELPVEAHEPPGTVVENCFVILSVDWRDQPWRVLARLTVTFDGAWAPDPRTVVVTAQPVGFGD